MAPDAIGSIARHQADHEAAGHRHEHDEATEHVLRGSSIGDAECLEEEQVGEEGDELEQREREHCAQNPEQHRDCGYPERAPVGSKVAEIGWEGGSGVSTDHFRSLRSAFSSKGPTVDSSWS